MPDLGLPLEQGHVVGPGGQDLVVHVGGPPQRNARLILCSQVREDLPDSRLGRGQVGQDGRVVAAASEELLIEG